MTNNTQWDTCLVVATAGHVWVARTVTRDDHFLHLGTARIVREWGTANGLNELVTGPTKQTKLDAIAPVVSVANIAVIAIIPCRDDGWAASL